MITTTLFGGLGNQMFIYAMARAMSLRNGVNMAFNLKRGFELDLEYHRKLELSHFNVTLPTASISTFDFMGGRLVKKISRTVKRNVFAPNYQYLEELRHQDTDKLYHFQKEMTNDRYKNVYLDGYWQSPLYFEDFSDVIRDDFKIVSKMPVDVEDELSYLKSQNRPLVMVGVRRYQEVKHASILKDHACDVFFYNRAIQIIKEKVSAPLFVIFSQDQDWVKQNFPQGNDYYYVRNKDGALSTVSDMYLMTLCDYAIISNSTYYWWGAWLSKSKMVISSKNFINADSNCKEWIVI